VAFDWSPESRDLSKQQCYWLTDFTSRQKQAWLADFMLLWKVCRVISKLKCRVFK